MARAPQSPISLGAKLAIAVGAAALNAVIYLLPNHYTFWPTHPLPWTAVDRWVPFVPATVWIYVSDYVLVASAFLLATDRAATWRFVRSYLAMLVTGSSIHLFWPTVFPRDQFPLVGDGLTERLFELLRAIDLPGSCMPSMHVASSYLAAFSLWRNPRWQFAGWVSWATAIAVSTLTAKQHYAIDVLAGLLMALGFWLIFFWAPTATDLSSLQGPTGRASTER